MTILYIIGAIGFLVCWIMTLIKMFKSEKPLLGILGILCWLWTFIWGWMNASKQGHQKIMIIWTICLILCIVSGALGGVSFSVDAG
jgi:hypothetical protein